MTVEGFDRRLARIAAAQYGVFARAQATDLGATKGMIQHRLRTGRWERLAPDVFVLAGGPSSWRRSLSAACLAWGPGAVVSHRAAAALWRLSGFEPGPVELTLPRRRRVKASGVAHHGPLRPEEVTTIDGIPVTSPARTLLDLAAVAAADAVEEALDDALRRRIVSMPRLRREIAEVTAKGRAGVKVMRSLLDARDAPSVPQSVFETRLLRILKRAGIPTPALQYHVRRGDRMDAVVDFAFPASRVAVEADGYRWHSGRIHWEHDRVRRNELTLLGWRVIHVTWTDLSRRPQTVVDSVRRALDGGSGSPPTAREDREPISGSEPGAPRGRTLRPES